MERPKKSDKQGGRDLRERSQKQAEVCEFDKLLNHLSPLRGRTHPGGSASDRIIRQDGLDRGTAGEVLTKEPAKATQVQRSRVCPTMVAIKRRKVEKNLFKRREGERQCLVSDQPKREKREDSEKTSESYLSMGRWGGACLQKLHSPCSTWQLLPLLFSGFESKICNITTNVKELGKKLKFPVEPAEQVSRKRPHMVQAHSQETSTGGKSINWMGLEFLLGRTKTF